LKDKKMTEQKSLKVAFVSKNGKDLVGAFGSSKFFAVYTLQEGKVMNQEVREVYKDKMENEVPNILKKNNGETGSAGLSFSLNVVDVSKEKHMKIAKSISDCDMVVARAMCANAYDSVQQFKMQPIITDVKSFEEGVEQIIAGTLVNHTDKIGKKSNQ